MGNRPPGTDMLAWDEFDRRVAAADDILLTTHVRPDGDALGSELGLRALLMQRGKTVRILNPSPTPDRYRFLDPERSVINNIDAGFTKPPVDPDLIVVLDTGTWS